MSEPAIELRGLEHRYETTLVLRDVDLTIEQGEIFGFRGHNGAGRTTTLNILTTLITPTAGTATICGYDVVADRREVTRLIGSLPTDVRMYGHMTAAENLKSSRSCPASPAHAPPHRRRSTTRGVPISPRGGWAPFTPECDSGSGSRRPSCINRKCCCSASRPQAWTRWESDSCGRPCSSSTATAT